MFEPNPFRTLHLLQLTFTADEYLQTIRPAMLGDSNINPLKLNDAYWQRLPTYIVARCPLCHTPYTEKLDTHSIRGWDSDPNLWSAVNSDFHSRCHHFVSVQTFVNLNGHLPTELKYYWSQYDIPFLMPFFLPNDHPAFAVLHSLPICHIEEGQFVPRYIVYMMTYYAESPPLIEVLRRQYWAAKFKSDTDAHVPRLELSGERDLPKWVERGRLLWLDPSSPDLALKSGPLEEFPYVDIKGYGQPHTVWHGNKVELR